MPLRRLAFSLVLAAAARAVDSQTVRMIEAEGEARQYWPQWRDPSGQGLVEGKQYTDTWSAAKNVRWKVSVPGAGHSSPIVGKDRIFLTTAHDGSRRVLACFRCDDGKLLWEAAAPQSGPVERLYWKNSYATATPATDGERVYALFGNAGLIAVDFNGKLVWHYGFGAASNYHGPGGSSLLYKGRVFFYQDQRSDSFVAAIDAKTGRLLWKTPRREGVGWGAPVAIHTGVHDEIVINRQYAVRAYDPDTGRELWTARGPTTGFGNGSEPNHSPRSGVRSAFIAAIWSAPPLPTSGRVLDDPGDPLSPCASSLAQP